MQFNTRYKQGLLAGALATHAFWMLVALLARLIYGRP
jgi:hypothetical protein